MVNRRSAEDERRGGVTDSVAVVASSWLVSDALVSDALVSDVCDWIGSCAKASLAMAG